MCPPRHDQESVRGWLKKIDAGGDGMDRTLMWRAKLLLRETRPVERLRPSSRLPMSSFAETQ